jgi:hypothetical protein
MTEDTLFLGTFNLLTVHKAESHDNYGGNYGNHELDKINPSFVPASSI